MRDEMLESMDEQWLVKGQKSESSDFLPFLLPKSTPHGKIKFGLSRLFLRN